MASSRNSQWPRILSPIRVRSSDFKIGHPPIGKGTFGEVSTATFNGNNSRIKDLGLIVVKNFIGSLGEASDNDPFISPYLFQAAITNPRLGDKYNAGIVVVDEENHQRLISQFVTYHKDPPPKSGNLESYFRRVNANSNTSFASFPLFNNNNLAITLSQFAFSMKDSQNAVHEAGVFHFDTAARNFLVGKPICDASGNILQMALKISDFGLSEIMPPNGIVHLEDKPLLPSRWLDSSTLYRQGHSIVTDLYALKISMLEAIGLALGVTNTVEELLIFPGQTLGHFFDFRIANTDSEALKLFLANAEAIASNHLDPERGKQVKLMIDCYRDYLTTMPSGCKKQGYYTPEEVQAIRAEDNKLFLEATAKFKNTMKNALSVHPQQDILHQRLAMMTSELDSLPSTICARSKEQYQHIQLQHQIAQGEEKLQAICHRINNMQTHLEALKAISKDIELNRYFFTLRSDEDDIKHYMLHEMKQCLLKFEENPAQGEEIAKAFQNKMEKMNQLSKKLNAIDAALSRIDALHRGNMNTAPNPTDALLHRLNQLHNSVIEKLEHLPDSAVLNDLERNRMIELLKYMTSSPFYAEINKELQDKQLSLERLREIQHYIISDFIDYLKSMENIVTQDCIRLGSLVEQTGANLQDPDIRSLQSDIATYVEKLRFMHTRLMEMETPLAQLVAQPPESCSTAGITSSLSRAALPPMSQAIQENRAGYISPQAIVERVIEHTMAPISSVEASQHEDEATMLSLPEKLTIIKSIVNAKKFWDEQAKIRVTGVDAMKKVLNKVDIESSSMEDLVKINEAILEIARRRAEKSALHHRSAIGTNLYKAIVIRDDTSLQAIANTVGITNKANNQDNPVRPLSEALLHRKR